MRQMWQRSANKLPGASRSSHYSDEWYTPNATVQALGEFDLDPCAGPKSHARRNIRRPVNGLKTAWRGRVWLNPPYSDVHSWLDRLIEHGNGIALVNARPETLWFQTAAAEAEAALWIRRRVEFERPDGVPTRPPVGQVLLAYGEQNAQAMRDSAIAGIFMRIHGKPVST